MNWRSPKPSDVPNLPNNDALEDFDGKVGRYLNMEKVQAPVIPVGYFRLHTGLVVNGSKYLCL